MAKDPKSTQQLGFLRDEVDAAYLYRAIAERPGHPELAQLYRNLADDEERHAEYWRELLAADGVNCDHISPTMRTRALAAVARRFGARVIIPVMARREIAEHYAYDTLGDDRPAEMVAEEQSHARLVQVARRHHTIEDLDGLQLARLQGKPRVVGGNAAAGRGAWRQRRSGLEHQFGHGGCGRGTVGAGRARVRSGRVAGRGHLDGAGGVDLGHLQP